MRDDDGNTVKVMMGTLRGDDGNTVRDDDGNTVRCGDGNTVRVMMGTL